MSDEVLTIPASAPNLVAAARAALDRRELLVIPTDTVYGIGADPFDTQAVDRLLQVKGRSSELPPPILAADWAQVERVCRELGPIARALGRRYWPGALTLICPGSDDLGWDLATTDGTVAVRIPDHPQTREVLRATGPLAVSSANLHGAVPATKVRHAIRYFGTAVGLYIDGGATPGVLASTIFDTRTRKVIREGVIPGAKLRALAEYTLGAEAVPGAES